MSVAPERIASPVSVLMSARNAEAFLPAAIESILSQSYRNYEFIVVDDRSTDRTASIIDRYARKDGRIRHLTGEGRGLAAALNLGLRQAGGRLIARMDADDIACPPRLEKQVAWMDANPGVVALGSAVVLIDGAGRRLRTRRVRTDPADIARDLPVRNALCHPSMVIRAEPLQRAGGYRERFLTAQDYDLWLRLLDFGAIANLPEPLLRYRKHNRRISDAGNRGRTTVYSVAAAADYFGRMVGEASSEEAIDLICPTAIAEKLEMLLQSALPIWRKQQMLRHVLRFLRVAGGLPEDRRKSLRAAARPYMTLKDHLKALVYRV